MLQQNLQYKFKTVTVKNSFTLPCNVIETYKMISALNNLVFQRLQPFRTRPISTELKNVLVYLDSYHQKEQNILKEHLLYELNLRAQQFYNSLGLVIEEDFISEEHQRAIDKLLTKELNTIDNRIRCIDNRIARKEKNLASVFSAWLDLRDNISFLYRKLARLYPDGSVRDTLIAIADILDKDQDSIILSNKLFDSFA